MLATSEAVVQAADAGHVVLEDTAAWYGDSPVSFYAASKPTSLIPVANGNGDHALCAVTSNRSASTGKGDK